MVCHESAVRRTRACSTYSPPLPSASPHPSCVCPPLPPDVRYDTRIRVGSRMRNRPSPLPPRIPSTISPRHHWCTRRVFSPSNTLMHTHHLTRAKQQQKQPIVWASNPGRVHFSSAHRQLISSSSAKKQHPSDALRPARLRPRHHLTRPSPHVGLSATRVLCRIRRRAGRQPDPTRPSPPVPPVRLPSIAAQLSAPSPARVASRHFLHISLPTRPFSWQRSVHVATLVAPSLATALVANWSIDRDTGGAVERARVPDAASALFLPCPQARGVVTIREGTRPPLRLILALSRLPPRSCQSRRRANRRRRLRLRLCHRHPICPKSLPAVIPAGNGATILTPMTLAALPSSDRARVC